MTVTVYNFFVGGPNDETVDRSTSTEAWVLGGGGGADTVLGGSSNDHLYGNSPDTTQGTADGSDLISGGAGNDYIQGNAGDDVLRGDDGADRIYGGAGSDTMSGGDGTDYLQGNKGQDVLDGGSGNDILHGGADNDQLDGGTGNDQLFGDNGDDTVRGGLGLDHLTGGAGRDVFQYGQNDALITADSSFAVTETIIDWNDGTDSIDLAFDVTQVIAVGGQSFTDLAAARAFASQLLANDPGTGEVAAVGIGNDTWLFFNGSGGDSVDSAIRLAGIQPSAIGTGDFS